MVKHGGHSGIVMCTLQCKVWYIIDDYWLKLPLVLYKNQHWFAGLRGN